MPRSKCCCKILVKKKNIRKDFLSLTCLLLISISKWWKLHKNILHLIKVKLHLHRKQCIKCRDPNLSIKSGCSDLLDLVDPIIFIISGPWFGGYPRFSQPDLADGVGQCIKCRDPILPKLIWWNQLCPPNWLGSMHQMQWHYSIHQILKFWW